MKKTLEKIIDYAVAVAEPEKVILFGSIADNKSNVYSDIDLLIISENQLIKKDAIARICNFAKEYCLKADVLIYTSSEIKELNIPNSFIAAIIKTGKVVYRKKNF